MFNNVVLEVVIGLVFIYLLYSLLVTILGEYIAYKLGIRQRLLRFAIERMLNDGYYEKIEKIRLKGSEGHGRITKPVSKIQEKALTWWWIWLRKVWLYESADFKNSFAGRFYDYSSIKYLSKIENKRWLSNSKPAYISADNFADTLVNILKDKGGEGTDEERVDFSLSFNTYYIQMQTLRQLLNLWSQAKGQIPAFKTNLKQWFTETMDRTNGWHKQKMQFLSLMLGFILAAIFNVDTIKITRILAKDKDARAQLVEMSIKAANDTTRYKHFIEDTPDSVRGKVVDSVYTLLRKDINAASAILGLGWNLSALRKRKTVDVKDSSAIASLRQSLSSIDTTRKISEVLARTAGRKREISSHRDSIRVWNMDIAAGDPSRKDMIDSTNREIKKLMRKIFVDSLWLNLQYSNINAMIERLNELTKENFVAVSAVEKMRLPEGGEAFRIVGTVSQGNGGKLRYWLKGVWENLFGLLITGIALSFGAPFWFDILKKVVTLRHAGVKPEEKPDQSAIRSVTVSDTPVVTNAPVAVPVKGKDPVEDALLQYGPPIRAVAGVKSVFTFMEDDPLTPGKKRKNIQINVIDAMTQAEVLHRFSKLAVGNAAIMPRIKITGKAVTHNGRGIIYLKNTVGCEGSLGLVLKKKDSGTAHILSCWHVMKDLRNNNNLSSTILDHTDKGLADRWGGNIRGPFDYALARIFAGAPTDFNNFLKQHFRSGANHFSIRAVTQDDIDNQIPVKYLDCLAATPVVQEGLLYTDSTGVEIEYPDKTRTVSDILLLTRSLQQPASISQPGNSGSVIFDAQNRAIGMIIGGDLDFTYAIKLSNIINVHTEMTIA